MPPKRKNKRSVPAAVTAFCILYTKHMVFARWYDNNGVDEQGVYTTIHLQNMLPSSSSAIGNDYNAKATLLQVNVGLRYSLGLTNPPVAVQVLFSLGGTAFQDGIPSSKRMLQGGRNTVLSCKPPPSIADYIIDNPSDETRLRIYVAFYGMDLTAADIPTLTVRTKMKELPKLFIARSGK